MTFHLTPGQRRALRLVAADQLVALANGQIIDEFSGQAITTSVKALKRRGLIADAASGRFGLTPAGRLQAWTEEAA